MKIKNWILCFFGIHQFGLWETVKKEGEPLQFERKCCYCDKAKFINSGDNYILSPNIQYDVLIKSIYKEDRNE